MERRFLAKRIFDATVGRGYLERAAPRAGGQRRRTGAARRARASPAARIALLPNPIDEREFDPAPEGARFRQVHGLGNAPLVLLLAKLTPRKGGGELLRAFSQLESPGRPTGDRGQRHGLRHRPRRHRRRPRVSGASACSTGRARLDALAAADVVVYPSRDEVFGLVPIEALLAGSPVIVCNDSGAGEIIGAIGGGHIVPPGDVQSLRRRDRRRCSTPTACGVSGPARRPSTRGTRFGADVVCERLEAIYRRRARSAGRRIGALRVTPACTGVSFVMPVYNGRRRLREAARCNRCAARRTALRNHRGRRRQQRRIASYPRRRRTRRTGQGCSTDPGWESPPLSTRASERRGIRSSARSIRT